MSERNRKLEERDYRGPKEPTYKPKGLRWVYWSDLGSTEGLEFIREREPHLDEVQEWLLGQGFTLIPVEDAQGGFTGG
jgi:hypothetical protein